MEKSPMTVEHFTPKAEELQPFHKIECTEGDCSAIFTNVGNYEMHLERRHKIFPVRKQEKESRETTRLFHCPEADCIYNYNKSIGGRHFKQMKNLRQHFQKVHTKNFVCEICGRIFPTHGQLTRHSERECGKTFVCGSCNLEFQTWNGLWMHTKRKGHVSKESHDELQQDNRITLEEDKKCLGSVLQNKRQYKSSHKVTKRTRLVKKSKNHKETQIEFFVPNDMKNFTNAPSGNFPLTYHNIETQTLPCNGYSLLEDDPELYHDIETQTEIRQKGHTLLDDIHALYHDIETQTEPSRQQEISTRRSSLLDNGANTGGFLDQILTHSSSAAVTEATNIHTQTCDDYLLSELGLTDIQTQTNWSSFAADTASMEPSKHLYSSTSTSTSTPGSFAHDELLVSTETQTSFTQCLLDSTATVGSVNTVTATGVSTSDESTSTFAHLYNTQHTQTCELLLEGLFGSQETDLISNFQSTYTQT